MTTEDPRAAAQEAAALTEFLLARIAEGGTRDGVTPSMAAYAVQKLAADHDRRRIALEWADHPDYRPEWKP